MEFSSEAGKREEAGSLRVKMDRDCKCMCVCQSSLLLESFFSSLY